MKISIESGTAPKKTGVFNDNGNRIGETETLDKEDYVYFHPESETELNMLGGVCHRTDRETVLAFPLKHLIKAIASYSP